MGKNDKLNVLFLTFWSPPVIRPRAITIGKLMPEFIKQGINPVIITYENDGQWEIEAPVYKIPQFKINKFFEVIKIRGVFKYLYFRKISKLAEALIRRYEIDVIFSFSNPQESNLAGAMIKTKTGIPFISHFSDPWYDNSYKEFSKISALKVLRLERFIIKNSARVIFINQAEQNLIMKKFPAGWQKKARVVKHCFDPADYPAAIKENDGKYIFSHIGAFYRQRNPEIFFMAVAEAIKRNEKSRLKIKIQLIGCVPAYSQYTLADLKILIKKYSLEDLVEILPQVDFKTSLEYMKLADCLITIDANMPDSIFSPSKLFDYAGSLNPIIGITPAGSPTQEFLSNLGYESFFYNQTGELAGYINKLVNRELAPELNQEFLKNFEVKNAAASYIKIYREAADYQNER